MKEEEEPMHYFNAAQRKKLAQKWKILSNEEKLLLRSSRARMGIKCDICNTVGYFRENCVNNCESPPATPQSNGTVSSYGSNEYDENSLNNNSVGIFWGSTNKTDFNNVHNMRTKVNKKIGISNNIKIDMNTVKANTITELEKLQNSDLNIPMYAYFEEAEEGYNKTYPELTLHQLMRRIMRLLQEKLQQNVQNLENPFDSTLLHPPSQRLEKKLFYRRTNKNQSF